MRTILLVHGMGQTTAADYRELFVSKITESLKLFGLTSKWKESTGIFSIEYDTNEWESTKIIAFGYNDLFESRREVIGNKSKKLLDRLNSIGLADNPTSSLVHGLSKIGAGFGKDKFFQTHFGDVLMYAFTTVGEQVRVSLANKIAGMIVQNTAPSDIHIVAHSLGAAVVHDTLSMLSARHTDRTSSQLNIVTHKLGSVHMIANVTRALDFYVPVDDSFVRPGRNGCTHFYCQYNHSLDPFAQVSPFKPKNDKSWISSGEYKNAYEDISTDGVSGGNVHGLGHYLLNPANSSQLVSTGLNVDLSELLPKARKAYGNLTLQGRAQKAKVALQKIKFNSEGSIKDLENALQSLSKFIRDIGSSWES